MADVIDFLAILIGNLRSSSPKPETRGNGSLVAAAKRTREQAGPAGKGPNTKKYAMLSRKLDMRLHDCILVLHGGFDLCCR